MSITAYTTSFTPKCGATQASLNVRTDATVVSGTGSAPVAVTTAATAYDWFSLLTTTTANLGFAYNAMSVSTAVGVQNKAFVAAIAQEARSALLPLVKAEYFAATLAPPLITTITDLISHAKDVLAANTIQSANIDAGTKTALAAAYAADFAVITAGLNRLKTLENKIYLVGDSIDITSAATNTAYAGIATATTFTGYKTYLSNLFDPAILGGVTPVSGVYTMPTLTATTFANAATIDGYYTTASTAVAASTTLAQLQALTEMSAQNIFDTYCMAVQGYASSGTTGWYSTASAPVGIIPGIDYEVHLTGNFQTGTAAQNSAGAPSSTTAFWS